MPTHLTITDLCLAETSTFTLFSHVVKDETFIYQGSLVYLLNSLPVHYWVDDSQAVHILSGNITVVIPVYGKGTSSPSYRLSYILDALWGSQFLGISSELYNLYNENILLHFGDNVQKIGNCWVDLDTGATISVAKYKELLKGFSLMEWVYNKEGKYSK